jgi:hypothetical protein
LKKKKENVEKSLAITLHLLDKEDIYRLEGNSFEEKSLLKLETNFKRTKTSFLTLLITRSSPWVL